MPEVTTSSIEDVLLGTQMVSALMYGAQEVYVRLETYSYETPGAFSFTLPDWATGYGVVLAGGGGGGRCGRGDNGAQGYGGRGGEVRATWGRLGSSSGKVLTGTVGVGGAGGMGTSGGDSVYGRPGGDTTFTAHTSTVYTAAGGTGNPTSGMTNGGLNATTFVDPYPKYINIPDGTPYPNGPAGTGNAGSGKRSGGGAGGNGGYFGSYTHGGKGGTGFVDIYVWGRPRHEDQVQVGTEQITLGTNTQARDQLRAALTARGVDYQTAKHIPFEIELVGTGSAQEMFRECAMLTTAPEMNASQVTNMHDMFSECTSLTYVPDLDTGQVTNMRGMFHNCSALTNAPSLDTSQVVDSAFMFTHCSSLTYVPDMDTSQNMDLFSMFKNCTSLTDGNVLLTVRLQGANTIGMIENSGMTREPFYEPESLGLTPGLEFAAGVDVAPSGGT